MSIIEEETPQKPTSNVARIADMFMASSDFEASAQELTEQFGVHSTIVSQVERTLQKHGYGLVERKDGMRKYFHAEFGAPMREKKTRNSPAKPKAEKPGKRAKREVEVEAPVELPLPELRQTLRVVGLLEGRRGDMFITLQNGKHSWTAQVVEAN